MSGAAGWRLRDAGCDAERRCGGCECGGAADAAEGCGASDLNLGFMRRLVT